MNTAKYFSRVSRFLKIFNFRNKKGNRDEISNELMHPRFEISQNDPLAQKMVPKSLLFMMYSKENEAFFV